MEEVSKKFDAFFQSNSDKRMVGWMRILVVDDDPIIRKLKGIH